MFSVFDDLLRNIWPMGVLAYAWNPQEAKVEIL